MSPISLHLYCTVLLWSAVVDVLHVLVVAWTISLSASARFCIMTSDTNNESPNSHDRTAIVSCHHDNAHNRTLYAVLIENFQQHAAAQPPTRGYKFSGSHA